MNLGPEKLHAFGPADRIRRTSEFEAVRRDGRRHSVGRFMVVFRKTEASRPKLGVVVTRDTGNAVVRNRWKRVVRDLFRCNRQLLPVGAECVVVIRRSTRGAPGQEDRQLLLGVFERLGKGTAK